MKTLEVTDRGGGGGWEWGEVGWGGLRLHTEQ